MDEFALYLEWAIISPWTLTRKQSVGIPADINTATAYVAWRKAKRVEPDVAAELARLAGIADMQPNGTSD